MKDTINQKEVEDFIVDLENGQYMIFYADGAEYKGAFKNGNEHGQGRYTYANGTKYEGEFENGKFHGQGTIIYADGDKYEGEWKNGVCIAFSKNK